MYSVWTVITTAVTHFRFVHLSVSYQVALHDDYHGVNYNYHVMCSMTHYYMVAATSYAAYSCALVPTIIFSAAGALEPFVDVVLSLIALLSYLPSCVRQISQIRHLSNTRMTLYKCSLSVSHCLLSTIVQSIAAFHRWKLHFTID